MNAPKRERGVVLLVVMMVLLSSSAFMLVKEHQGKNASNDEALQSLLAAKQALLAYAVNYADNYGHNTRGGTGRMPCPAVMQFSSPARSCSAGDIGYLPSVWNRDGQQMEIDYLERFLDRDIWYSVAADHRYNPAYNALSSIKGTGLLTVDTLQDIVAVLIAPGAATDVQNRGVVGQRFSSMVTEYLEGENADADATFTLSESNDLLVPIRRSELLPLMERRVLGFAKQWLIEYKLLYGFYPYAALLGADGQCEQALLRGQFASEEGNCIEAAMTNESFANLPSGRALHQTWFHRSGWPALIYYIVDETCTPARGLVDCDGVNDPQRLLTVNGNQAEVVLISVGEPIETTFAGGLQVRSDSTVNAVPNSDLVNYLDSTAVLTASTNYSIPTLTVQSNDQLVFIE